MAVDGSGNIVRHNQVVQIGGSTTFGTNANAIGIVVLGHGSGTLANNRVLDNTVSTIVKQGTGTAWGIFFASDTESFAVNNQITTADRGIDYSGGSVGKYRDNLTFDVTVPYSGGTDAGNNQ